MKAKTIGGRAVRRNFPGMTRECARGHGEYIITEAMCRRKTYQCPTCAAAERRKWKEQNPERWRAVLEARNARVRERNRRENRKAGAQPQSIRARFSKYAPITKTAQCCEWTGPRRKSGYGVLTVMRGGRRRDIVAHRLSWRLHFGLIPDGLFVLHKCDNPPCVNPAHLFLGTQAENMEDMKRKGRSPRHDTRGEKNPAARLTPALVREIRTNRGTPAREFAIRLGVSIHAVREARQGKTWGHLQS